jgi:hypothetical protein
MYEFERSDCVPPFGLARAAGGKVAIVGTCAVLMGMSP